MNRDRLDSLSVLQRWSRALVCFVRVLSVLALLDRGLATRCFWPRRFSDCMCFANASANANANASANANANANENANAKANTN